MRNKILAGLLVFVLASASLTACGENKNTAEQENEEIDSISEENSTQQATGNSNTEASKTPEAEEAEVESEPAEAYSFQELSKYSFEFCSGAGGWSTDFNIAEDGSFSGIYHDSDMGDFGEGFENGTLYYSAFSGHFSELTQVDEYTCEMTISDISYENELDTEEIIDQIRYCYTDAYGLTGTTKFLVYFPGTPVSTFDEEIYSWIQWSIEEGSDVLTRPVIVNVDQEEGIYSYDYE